MDSDIHHQGVFGQAQNVGRNAQMSRRAHGEKFRDALDGGEDKYFKERHGVWPEDNTNRPYSTGLCGHLRASRKNRACCSPILIGLEMLYKLDPMVRVEDQSSVSGADAQLF